MTSPIQATRVGDIMTQGLVTVGPDEPLGFAHELMLWSQVRHLPVVDGPRLLGLIDEPTLLHAMLGGEAKVTREIMAEPRYTLDPNDDLGEAAARMVTHRIDAMPVLSEAQLVGLLTTTDVLAERGRLFFRNKTIPHVPTVATLMREKVLTAHLGDLLVEAVATLVEAGIRHLPVLDGDRQVVGMLTDRDIRTAVGNPVEALAGDAPELHEVRVEEVMNRAPLVIAHDASVADLASCFLDDRVGALPVVDDDDRLCGIVSYVDLIRHAVATRSR
ncbi:MAG: CBS domain-containing protein [Myxococcota bacterium]